MNVLGIIPARYESSRLPGKPLAMIGDKPMIQHVFENTLRTFTYVYVATDDLRIYNAVQGFGGNAVMTSAHHTSGTDRCAEALQQIEYDTELTFEVVVNIQGDEPFLQTDVLSELSAVFLDRKVQIATLIKKTSTESELMDPNRPKVVVSVQNDALYFSRHPIPFLRAVPQSDWLHTHTYYSHIGVYAYRAKVLKEITLLPPSLLEKAESLEQNRWLENGYTIRTLETDIEALSVDTPGDLEKARSYWASIQA